MSPINSSYRSGTIEGIVITVFEDNGPANLFNSSSLSEDDAFNMALRSLTVIGSDVPLDYGEIRSYGPIPTPRLDLFSLGFIFTLRAVDSEDSRISKFGRLVVIWVITRSDTAIRQTGVIKRVLQRMLRINRITTDEDIRKEDIWRKIDENLRNIEMGVERYYISEEGNMESFLDIGMVPIDSPILLVDTNGKQLTVLIREKISPGKKSRTLRTVNNYKRKLHKGSLFKIEIISDPKIIQTILSKHGLITSSTEARSNRLKLSQELSYTELNQFFEFHISPKKQELLSRIISLYRKKEQINLHRLSVITGFCLDLIEEFCASAINAGVLKGYKMENGVLYTIL
ncbi:MAG: hypothetical protein ACTSW1_18285 [Candidatus Hodarchaeales archaeon]